MCKRNPKIHENWPYSLKIEKLFFKMAIKSKNKKSFAFLRVLLHFWSSQIRKKWVLVMFTSNLHLIYLYFKIFPRHLTSFNNGTFGSELRPFGKMAHFYGIFSWSGPNKKSFAFLGHWYLFGFPRLKIYVRIYKINPKNYETFF